MGNKTNYDLIIKPKEVKRLKERHSGIYILISSKNEQLYVGQSADLFTRVRGHLGYGSELSGLSKHFKRVGFIFEKDNYKKDLIEDNLIKLFQPPLNIEGNSTYQCNGITSYGNRCRLIAYSNGYCHHHGGNHQTFFDKRRRYEA